MTHITWFSDFTSYLEDYLMYKYHTLVSGKYIIYLYHGYKDKKTITFFLSIYPYFFCFTLNRYCCSPVIKVTDLKYFIFIAFTLKFGVKKFAFRRR